MKKRTHNPCQILLAGYIVLAMGAPDTCVDILQRSEYHFPFNLGIVLGNGAIMITALFVQMISKCLIDIQSRLNRIEALLPGVAQDERNPKAL